jgi:hypothetical protein
VTFWICLALLCGVLMVPLFVVDVPPILDYPNHLARLYVMAQGAGEPFLSRFYAVRWGVIPDLAIDSFGPALMRVFPVHVAGRIMLAAVLLLTVAGVVAYSRAVFAARHYWAAASVLVAYNVTFLLGFLNFLLSLALALLCAAGWIAGRERRPRLTLALALPATAILFLAHLMGLAFFLILVASSEVEAVWRGWRHGDGVLRPLAARAARALPLLAVPLALYGLTHFSDKDLLIAWTPWETKLWGAAGGFVNYDAPVDIVSAGVVFGAVILGLAFGRVRVAPKSVAALIVLAILYAVLPFGLKGTSWLDIRPAIMFSLLMFGGLAPVRLAPRARMVATAVFVLVFGARMATVTAVWFEHQTDIDDFRAVIAPIAPGSRVFVVDITRDEAPAHWREERRGRTLSVGNRLDHHISAMIAIERHAFWPNMFADQAQQPVVRLQPYDDLAHYLWGMPTHAEFAADHVAPGGTAISLFDRFACHADYVLVTGAGADRNPRAFGAGYLDVLRSTGMATLYRVRSTETACPLAAVPAAAPG